MGWFTINKFIVFCLLIVLAGCGKEEKYTKQEIPTRPGTGIKLKDEIGIGLSYKVIKDAKIYTDPDEKNSLRHFGKRLGSSSQSRRGKWLCLRDLPGSELLY